VKKKILFVSYSVYGGGAEKRTLAILRSLDREKFEPELCVFSAAPGDAERLPPGVPLHVLSTRLRPASLFLYFKLLALIRRVRPDRVFSALWSVNLIALAAAARAGVPAVVTEATTPSVSVGSEPFSALKAALIRRFYRRAELIIAVADCVKRDLVKNFGVPDGLVKVILNGVDAGATARRAEEYKAPCSGHIAACGGLNWWKNYPLLIKAAARSKVGKVVIAGRGPLRGELMDLAGAEKVGLLLPGHLENPYPYIKAAVVFALTSVFEGLPNVVLEAMACGTPVVAVDCPGAVRELIEDGRTGLIVPNDDPAALAAAIDRVAGDPAFARALAANARAALTEKFSLPCMLKAYEEALSAPSRGR
jgi:glycosyltransferase involved in cell wall biosynthesis